MPFIQKSAFFVYLLFFYVLLPSNNYLQAQEYSYKKEVKLDLPLSIGSGLLWYYSHQLHKKKHILTIEEIEALDPQDISGFDRISTRNWSLSAHKGSNVLLFSSYAFPFTLLANSNLRTSGNVGSIGLLTFETVALNSAITGLTKELVKRKRPLLYNPQCPLKKKQSPNATSSFISGHTSNVAALSFMTAQIHSDLNPNSNANPYIWATAAFLPALTGYLRVKAGRHFPTDVIAGYIVGAAIGILVPKLHKVQVE